jgi:hypothetical protein
MISIAIVCALIIYLFGGYVDSPTTRDLPGQPESSASS